MNNEKHRQGTRCTKMGADSLAENTPNVPEFICLICLPKHKSSGFQWKKASLSVRSPWILPWVISFVGYVIYLHLKISPIYCRHWFIQKLCNLFWNTNLKQKTEESKLFTVRNTFKDKLFLHTKIEVMDQPLSSQWLRQADRKICFLII